MKATYIIILNNPALRINVTLAWIVRGGTSNHLQGLAKLVLIHQGNLLKGVMNNSSSYGHNASRHFGKCSNLPHIIEAISARTQYSNNSNT